MTDTRPINFRIPRHTDNALRALAEEDGVSMSQVLWRLVDDEYGRRLSGHGAWAELERTADVAIVAGPREIQVVAPDGKTTTISADHVLTARFDHTTIIVPMTDDMREDFACVRDKMAQSVLARAASAVAG
jgi:hypothetical protein